MNLKSNLEFGIRLNRFDDHSSIMQLHVERCTRIHTDQNYTAEHN